jgi:hypothetical protein
MVAGAGPAALGADFTVAGARVFPGAREPMLGRGTDDAGSSGSGFDRWFDRASVDRNANVRGSAIPVTCNPCARWNRLTASSVKMP